MRNRYTGIVRRRLAVLGVLACSLSTQVMAKNTPPKPAGNAVSTAQVAAEGKRKTRIKSFRQVGNASWYGKDLHGERTASGETFDQGQFTAAHATLPFGSLVKVTNLNNGRSTRVRINDRGPFTGGRIIDVSYAAAKVLGMKGGGLARVRLELVRSGVAVLDRGPLRTARGEP